MNKKKFLGFTSLVSLSFGLMVGCSDDSNPGSAIDNSQAQANACAAFGDYYTSIAVTGETMCYDAAGNLAFWINADGSYGFPVDEAGTPSAYIPQVASSSSIATEAGLSSAANTGLSSAGTAVPGISSSSIQGQVVPGVSSSSVGGTTPASSSAYVSESNGNSPAIAYATTGATVTNNNGCVTVTGGEVVITCAGDYDFSGSYKGADAQIRVNSPKADSGVYLNLRGLTLENTVDAPIYVQQASKAFVVAKKETVNTLTDAATRTKTFTYQNAKGETKVDTTAATIYSKDDLTIKGAGTLKVTGNANNGIHSANDLRFRGETIVTVNAKNNGVKGKGSVQIGSGTLTITTTEGDGIKSDECVESTAGECTAKVDGKGYVEITGGTINITAADDGISAVNQVRINENDGAVSMKITAGDGQPDKNSSGGSGFGGGMGGFGGGNWGRPGNSGNTGTTGSTTTTDISSKGIVAADSIIIEAGSVEIAAHKDAVHSNGYVDVRGGNLKLSGRNSIHADEAITIYDGTIYMPESYEALEAKQIIAKGGVTASNSSNDGWNASAGGEQRCSNCKVEVTGGVHYVHVGSGDTDGIDSNGDIKISGGVMVVECEISGGMGGSFDSDGSASITSKTVLGFSKSRSEAGTSYNVSFNTSGYYGNSNIAFKPTTSGSYIQATSQPSAVSNVSSYAKSTALPNGLTVYYNN